MDFLVPFDRILISTVNDQHNLVDDTQEGTGTFRAVAEKNRQLLMRSLVRQN